MSALTDLIAAARGQSRSYDPEERLWRELADAAEKELASLRSGLRKERALYGEATEKLAVLEMQPSIDLEALRKLVLPYHEERARYRGASQELHERIVSWGRSLLAQLEGAKGQRREEILAGWGGDVPLPSSFLAGEQPFGAPKPEEQTCPECQGQEGNEDPRLGWLNCPTCNGSGKVAP